MWSYIFQKKKTFLFHAKYFDYLIKSNHSSVEAQL